MRLMVLTCAILLMVACAPAEAFPSPSPEITSSEAVELVRSHLLSNTANWATNNRLFRRCFGSQRVESSSSYLTNGHWMVITPGACGYVVNDRTGLVTGP